MKKSLSGVLIFRITLVIICINALIGFAYYSSSVQQAQNAFQKRIDIQAKHLGDTFTRQLWLFDLNSAEQLSELTVSAPDISGLRLMDHKKNVLIEKGSFAHAPFLDPHKELHYEGETLVGFLDLSFVDPTWNNQKKTLLIVSFGMVGATILLTLLMLRWLLSHHLTQPLKELQQDMVTLSEGHFKSSQLVPKTSDIQSILNVFNKMAAALAERKEQQDQAQQELFNTTALLQAAMDCCPAGIAIADAPDGTLRYVNNAGLIIRNEDRKNIVDGVGLEQYVNSWQIFDLEGNPLATEEDPLARALLYGERNSREVIIKRDDGDGRIVFANAAPVLDKAGEIVAAIVIFQDITSRKEAEQELLRHKDALDDLVEERTKELKNALKLMTGREIRMAELKTSMDRLKTQLLKAGITPEIDDNYAERSPKK